MDELGIGVIRDAFSNLFFPGTSTIQTRAKYFFICPYAIDDACRNPYCRSSKDIIREVDNIERDSAVKMCANAKSTIGIIGATKLDTWIVRKPYNIYWNGLKTYGLLKEDVSITDIAKYYEELKSKKDNIIKGKAMEDDIEGTGDDKDAGEERQVNFWDIPAHNNWRDNLSIELTKDEAVFLEEHILNNTKDTLLSLLLQNHKQYNLETLNSFEELFEAINPFVSDSLSYKMELAKQFSDFSYFIGTMYNRALLGEEAVSSQWEEIMRDKDKYLRVDINSVFAQLKLFRYSDTYTFLNDIKNALSKEDWDTAEKVLKNREIRIKQASRAKLLHKEKYSSWVGIGKLEYRFHIAKQIITDIYSAKNA